MAINTDKLTQLNQKSMEAAMKLAQSSAEKSQKLLSLQTKLAQDLFKSGLANAKATTKTTDPKELVQLSTQYAQETTLKLVAAAKEMTAMGQETRNELTKMLTTQLASGGKDVATALQGFIKGLPAQPPNVMASLQKAMTTANGAIEQVAKASTAALGTVGEEVKKRTGRNK